MAFEKIDSSAVSLYYTYEEEPGVIGDPAIWHEVEVNSFADFGQDVTTVARRVFSQSRQRRKGTPTDSDADGGINVDVTQNNLQNILQAFFFADIREKPSNIPFNGDPIALADVEAGNGTYNFAEAIPGLVAGHIVKTTGFKFSANNGVFIVQAVNGAEVVTSNSGSIVEAATSGARMEVVGFQFQTGAATLDGSADRAVLAVNQVTDPTDLTSLGLSPGQWVFVGDDIGANSFDGVTPGYARISVIDAHSMTFDKTTFIPADNDGDGRSITVYFGNFLRNEDDPDLIVRRLKQFQRTLGRDNDGVQSDYLISAAASEITWNSPLSDKVTVDLGYVATRYVVRKGDVGPKTSEPGAVKVRAPNEQATNTAEDVFQLRMNVIDASTLNPMPLFARVQEFNISITNNISANKGQGIRGAFDTTAGLFEVSGSMTAYFNSVEAIEAINENADVAMHAIYANRRGAMVFDLPLIGLGGGRLGIELDTPITIPVEMQAVESPYGFTAGITWFSHIPAAGRNS